MGISMDISIYGLFAGRPSSQWLRQDIYLNICMDIYYQEQQKGCRLAGIAFVATLAPLVVKALNPNLAKSSSSHAALLTLFV
jgi:hypothetical protein